MEDSDKNYTASPWEVDDELQECRNACAIETLFRTQKLFE